MDIDNIDKEYEKHILSTFIYNIEFNEIYWYVEGDLYKWCIENLGEPFCWCDEDYCDLSFDNWDNKFLDILYKFMNQYSIRKDDIESIKEFNRASRDKLIELYYNTISEYPECPQGSHCHFGNWAFERIEKVGYDEFHYKFSFKNIEDLVAFKLYFNLTEL